MAGGRDLAALNRKFLGLLGQGSGGGLGLDPALRVRVAGLTPAAARRLATLPFALFGFRFAQPQEWAALLSLRVTEPQAPAEPGLERFTLLALAVLRHQALYEPRRAAACLGLPEAIGLRLVEIEIGELEELAPAVAGRLRCRFVGLPGVWHALLAGCEEDDARLLELARALGLQWTIRRALGLGACRSRRGFRSDG
jgi:hypothetical protein